MTAARNNRIPSAIESYLELPTELSLVLLTSTLSCSANWLTALFAGPALDSRSAPVDREQHAIILVSWMRDVSFWTDEIRRTTNLDVAKLSHEGSFAFLDYLKIEVNESLRRAAQDIKDAINKAKSNGKGKILLILDDPDVLLATQSATTKELNNCITELRALTHSMVISCSADLPLVAAADQSSMKLSTPMEVDTATFLTHQAHNASLIMSVHELSSGAAKDISGALRITRGGDENIENERGPDIPEKELLYFIQRDGTVKVFGRGEGNI